MPKPSDPERFAVDVTPPTMTKQMLNFVNEDGSKVLIETNAPAASSDVLAEPRLRKVPGKVTDNGLEYIQDAISLKRATLASVMPG